MYAYVTSQAGRHVSKREIYEHVEGYDWPEDASDKCAEIRLDMKYANALDHDVIIVFEKQEYYAALEKDEALKFYNRKVRSLKTIVKELNVLGPKISRDGQCSLLVTEDGSGIHIVFPNDHKSEAEASK
jgi:hypothetical protein